MQPFAASALIRAHELRAGGSITSHFIGKRLAHTSRRAAQGRCSGHSNKCWNSGIAEMFIKAEDSP